MVKALAKLKQLLGEQAAQWYPEYFERVGRMPGANRVFRRIRFAADKEELADYLAEIRYAFVFASLGFQVEFEPSGQKGPDLGIARDDRRAIVEVMRFRKIHPGPPLLNVSDVSDEDLVLPTYGNPVRDVRKALDKILAKFEQVRSLPGIIAIWNDDEDLEEVETQVAVCQICNDVGRGILSLPSGLLFVLYGSSWVGDKQLYCFPFRPLDQRYETWKAEIEMAVVSDHVQRALSPSTNTG
ncbi:MAG TPA: hypothetical protein VJH03_10920 [Blastocatellia bacterium]|nr:hypothetical protein [Blastocatellia bacterium]